jgi:hypothetical protein
MSSSIRDVVLGMTGPVWTRDAQGDVLQLSERVAYRVPDTVDVRAVERRLDTAFAVEFVLILVATTAIPFSWSPLLIFPLLLVQMIVDRAIARIMARHWGRCPTVRENAAETSHASRVFLMLAAVAALSVGASRCQTTTWMLVGAIAFLMAILWLRRTRTKGRLSGGSVG